MLNKRQGWVWFTLSRNVLPESPVGKTRSQARYLGHHFILSVILSQVFSATNGLCRISLMFWKQGASKIKYSYNICILLEFQRQESNLTAPLSNTFQLWGAEFFSSRKFFCIRRYSSFAAKEDGDNVTFLFILLSQQYLDKKRAFINIISF